MSVSNGFIAARAALAEAGISLTFIREIPDTRVCAATWWITGEKPAIGITERYRKADIFWFNLLHEVRHIALHPRRTTFLNLDDERRINDPKEHEADSFADEILFPDDTNLEIATARSHRDLIMIAARLRIGLPTVAGRHGKLTNNWKFAGRLREKITDDDISELEANSAEPAAL
jgi:HTH-type transcriptional regulator / antitoxin HigA